MSLTVSISIDTAKFDAALRQLMPPALTNRLRSAMQESLGYLQGQVQKETPVNFGLLRGSILPRPITGTAMSLTGTIGTPLVYGLVMERGRRPGKFPPIAPLELWAQRVIGKPGLGFVIARAIARKGSPARAKGGFRMFEKAAQRGVGTIERIFARWIGGG